MIIEFNGLPGTGKTTVAESLKHKLESDGIVCSLNYNVEESKIKRYFSYLFDGSIHLYFLGIKYADKSSVPLNKEKRRMVQLLIGYYRMYRTFMKKESDKVLIIDQGIIQAFISIVHTDKLISTVELNRILRFLKKRGIDFKRVSCKTDVELSASRIRLRNTDAGRLDKFFGLELFSALKEQENSFEKIRKSANEILPAAEIIIDTNLPIEENANIIYGRLI